MGGVCKLPCTIFIVFVSLELSSGRDLVIQMSVWCAACAVCRPCFFVRAYLGNLMNYLDDIWYVDGTRSEVAHVGFWAWQMPIKYKNFGIIYAKVCHRTSIWSWRTDVGCPSD